jgi:hypothetical protein
MTKPQYQLHILIKKNPRGFSAHCLELDLCEEGMTMAEATENIKNVIIAHITFAIENDNLAYLFHPAPEAVWTEYFESAAKAEHHVITITAKHPAKKNNLPTVLDLSSTLSAAA